MVTPGSKHQEKEDETYGSLSRRNGKLEDEQSTSSDDRLQGAQRWKQELSSWEWTQALTGWEWTQMLAGWEWIQVLSGWEWTQVVSGWEWIQVLSALEWTQVVSWWEWTQALSGWDWTQVMSGWDWTQVMSGWEWTQVMSGWEWTQMMSGWEWEWTQVMSWWECTQRAAIPRVEMDMKVVQLNTDTGNGTDWKTDGISGATLLTPTHLFFQREQQCARWKKELTEIERVNEYVKFENRQCFALADFHVDRQRISNSKAWCFVRGDVDRQRISNSKAWCFVRGDIDRQRISNSKAWCFVRGDVSSRLLLHWAEREEGQRLVFTRRVDSSVFSSGRVLTGADCWSTLQSNHGTVPLSTRQYRHVWPAKDASTTLCTLVFSVFLSSFLSLFFSLSFNSYLFNYW